MTLTRTELRSWIKLARGMKALLDALDRQLREKAGMSHDDYLILSRLHREAGRKMRMSDLAAEVGFSPSRLSHAVRRLEEERWVQRTPSATDRRGVEAALTEAGVHRLREVSPAHLGQVKRLIFETLGPDHARETADAIDQIGRAATVDGYQPT